MSNLPNLKPELVSNIVPSASDVQHVGHGGQKSVFSARIGGTKYALKFAGLPAPKMDEDSEDFATTDPAIRAKREVETMHDCDSPYMVKLGPVGLSFAMLDKQRIVYFSEEFIEGEDLAASLKTSGPFSPQEIAKLGWQIASAIKALWDLGKIHRDIKPANIMRRQSNGDYVLLDAGLAFDIAGESLSTCPVGTPIYFSPEQFDYPSRRAVLDFRSDIFALGVTMYVLATGVHPFFSAGDASHQIYDKIKNQSPAPIRQIIGSFPQQLESVILRMLGKSPHLRYRRCDQLIEVLKNC